VTLGCHGEWAGWVAFIALNHPHSRWGASARNCIGGWSAARARRSVTLQRSILTSSTDTPDRLMTRSMTICLGDTLRTVCPWSRRVRASSKIPFVQLVTFGLNQVFTCRRSMNYSRTVHGLVGLSMINSSWPKS
jgi:hypothetical protein